MKRMGKEDKDGAKPPSAKKMKQATLSFFAKANKQSSESKKRKKSESDADDNKVLKKVHCSDKSTGINDLCNKDTSVLQVKDENIDKHDSKKDIEVLIIDDSEENDVQKESKSEVEEQEDNSKSTVDSVHEDEGKSSPVPSSEAMDAEESELDTSSANVSLNVSSLIDNDDKDSLVSLSDIPLTPAKTSSASAKKPRRLTPKQLQRQLENQKRREEKEKEKEREKELALQEREKKKQEEKENRRRQQEEKEKQKQKEKMERQQKKQAEIDQKNEEKKAREEERRKKEEEKLQEKRRKEEEKLQEKRRKEEEKVKAEEEKKKAEEEALKKKEKAALAFASFFTVKKEQKEAPPPQSEEVVTVENRNFMPFSVKADMRVAPATRYSLKPEEKKVLDEDFVCQENAKLYLDQLKDKNYKPKTSSKTWPYSAELDDIVIIENKCPGNQVLMSTAKKEKMRAKLLLFNENRRPAYWGTWRKKSKCIGPRQPLAQDKTYFDYEVDSDDEWEEEEQGESLHGSDDEKESEDEYEVDNQMFVPHGYLSDDEEGLDEVVPPEMKKETLKVKEMEFQAEMKKKLKPLKPEIMGLFWQYPESPAETLTEWEWMYEGLKQFQVVRWSEEVPSFPPQGTSELEEDMDTETSAEARKNNNGNGGNSAQRGARPKVVPDEAIPDFIRMLHGNQNSKKNLAREFVEYWEKLKNPDYKVEVAEEETSDSGKNKTGASATKGNRIISLANACRTLKSLANWIQFPEEGPMHLKFCWYVPPDVRAKHNLTDLPLPNDWTYTLKNVRPRGRPKEDKATTEANTSLTSEETVSNKGTPKESLKITKFTKKLSEAERKQQIKRKSSVEITATPPNKIKIKSVTNSPFSPSSAFRISPNAPSTSSVPVGIKAYCTPSSSTKASPSCTPGSEFKAPAPVRTPTSGGEKKGRRVSILVSVPCGQEIPTEAAQAAADTFLKQSAPPVARAFQFSQAASSSNTNEDDDCVMLE